MTRTIEYDRDEPYAGIHRLVREGRCWPLFLGLGVDPLSLRAELLTAVVIEAGAFDKLFVGHWKLSGTPKEEGALITGSDYLGSPFEESYVDEYLRPGSNTLPAGAACLCLAWRWRDPIRELVNASVG